MAERETRGRRGRGVAVDGVRLRQARKARGLSMRELGRRVNLTAAAIEQYESGKSLPSVVVLKLLADELRKPADWFRVPSILDVNGAAAVIAAAPAATSRRR